MKKIWIGDVIQTGLLALLVVAVIFGLYLRISEKSSSEDGEERFIKLCLNEGHFPVQMTGDGTSPIACMDKDGKILRVRQGK